VIRYFILILPRVHVPSVTGCSHIRFNDMLRSPVLSIVGKSFGLQGRFIVIPSEGKLLDSDSALSVLGSSNDEVGVPDILSCYTKGPQAEITTHFLQ